MSEMLREGEFGLLQIPSSHNLNLVWTTNQTKQLLQSDKAFNQPSSYQPKITNAVGSSQLTVKQKIKVTLLNWQLIKATLISWQPTKAVPTTGLMKTLRHLISNGNNSYQLVGLIINGNNS
ncbi:hypothetical protein L249_5133 [Ophiocordyceps polyrhachis-furcata BCC 54312]|uniref:Uncharacterized protein n=1 Tax=Ophiocordyceps polyrhachis-furcata BCC 54312 TaxID=1330021 RepID=A0A367L3G9_9HYPO|nr:hypothetical protein L249_5133 [Ophiocordyceps polyrhachis-furcata BCC 54312]